MEGGTEWKEALISLEVATAWLVTRLAEDHSARRCPLYIAPSASSRRAFLLQASSLWMITKLGSSWLGTASRDLLQPAHLSVNGPSYKCPLSHPRRNCHLSIAVTTQCECACTYT